MRIPLGWRAWDCLGSCDEIFRMALPRCASLTYIFDPTCSAISRQCHCIDTLLSLDIHPCVLAVKPAHVLLPAPSSPPLRLPSTFWHREHGNGWLEGDGSSIGVIYSPQQQRQQPWPPNDTAPHASPRPHQHRSSAPPLERSHRHPSSAHSTLPHPSPPYNLPTHKNTSAKTATTKLWPTRRRRRPPQATPHPTFEMRCNSAWSMPCGMSISAHSSPCPRKRLTLHF